MESNPFNSVTYKKRELVEAGMYVARLKEVKPKEVQDKQTGEKKHKLIFVFALSDTGGEVSQFFNVSQSENSHLVKFLKGFGGLTEAIRDDKDAFWGYIKSRIGNHYHIMVTQEGEYNNITGATPVKTATAKVAPTSIEIEDDVPFDDMPNV